MSVPGLSLLGLKRIRGAVSILRSINPFIIIVGVKGKYDVIFGIPDGVTSQYIPKVYLQYNIKQ